MIEAYTDYGKGYVDFVGRTTVSSYWLAILAHVLVSFLLSFAMGVFEQLFYSRLAFTMLLAFQLLCLPPSIAIIVRRLHDAGYPWISLLWALLPVAGTVILVVKLCKPSIATPHTARAKAEQAGADRMSRWCLPAGVLLLWGALVGFVSILREGMLLRMPVYWWLSAVWMIALAILLLNGRKNIWLLIPVVGLLLLRLRILIVSFSIIALFYTVAYASVCLITVLSLFRWNKHARSSPPKILIYLPAGVFLALGLYMMILVTVRAGLSVDRFIAFVNDMLYVLCFLCFAKALLDTDTDPLGNEKVPGKTGPGPNARQRHALSAPYRSVRPGVLLIRFSIDKLNKLSGSYGFQSGKLIGRAVPPALMEGMTVSDGDSAATLAGLEYVCVVAIAARDSNVLKERIEPLLLASKELKENGATPLIQLVGSTREPLVVDGVVRNGKVEGPGGWCASGMMHAWKKQSERSEQLSCECQG